MQAVAPWAEYCPVEQASHAAMARPHAYLPDLQLVQLVFARASGCAKPAAQATHGVEALASWSGEPIGQPVHTARPAGA